MLTRRQRIWLFVPLALLLVPFLLLPALFGFLTSFTNYAPFQPAQSVRFVGLDNYLSILHDDTFRTAVRNVMVFAAASVSAELIGGFGLAYLLRESFRGRSIVRFLLLLPWVVSPVATGIMWHFLVNRESGMINYWPALLGLPSLPYLLTFELALPTAIVTEIWRKTPFVMFLVLPGLLAVPADQWDQARLEGLPVLGQIRHVALPRLRLLMLTITLLLLGDALGNFENIMMLTGGGPGSATTTPGFYSYQKAFVAFNWAAGTTSGWFIVAAVLLVGLVYVIMARRGAD
jgi:multiple sugar transport system permease protein